ncbi:MAG: STAS domain-containing protein [Terriglobia bacterium]
MNDGFSKVCDGKPIAQCQGEVANRGGWKLKIEKISQGDTTTIRLIGHFQAEHLGELKEQLQHNGPRIVLDLSEVTLVDVEVVRFLGACEVGGAELAHCSPYIREWIKQERKT